MKRVYTQTFGTTEAIIEKDGKILLVKETKRMAKDKWDSPGGWIDVGENPIEAIKREVKEETGFDFKPTYVLGVYSLHHRHLKKKFGVDPHGIKIVFVGEILNEVKGKLYDDVSETKWFLPEEIENMSKDTLRSMDIKKMIKDYFAGKRYPLDIVTHTVIE